MKLKKLRIEGLVEISPTRHRDERGYFSEIYLDGFFKGEIAPINFLQENQSFSLQPGLIRGLHFQTPPMAQGKLVRCVSGSIFDVAVDIRQGSATFGNWEAIMLTAEAGNQLWIPAGFLHGFCTLAPDTIVCYKVTSYYSKDHDAGVAWNDPEIGIEWPESVDPGLLSAKDRSLPLLKEIPAHFHFGEMDKNE